MSRGAGPRNFEGSVLCRDSEKILSIVVDPSRLDEIRSLVDSKGCSPCRDRWPEKVKKTAT